MEKNKNSGKKKAVIIIVIVILLAVGVFFAVKVSSKNKDKEQNLKNFKSDIVQVRKDFDTNDDETVKLEKLKEMISDYSEYADKSLTEKGLDENTDKEVDEDYSKEIAAMRKYFTDEYQIIIDENTLNDVDKIDDKDELNKAIENLTNLKTLIFSERKAVYEVGEETNTINEISTLIESYSDRIGNIESAENGD